MCIWDAGISGAAHQPTDSNATSKTATVPFPASTRSPQSLSPVPGPGDKFAAYRLDQRLGSAISFGINAIVVEGDGHELRLARQIQIECPHVNEEYQ
jgi:hypothetical protein